MYLARFLIAVVLIGALVFVFVQFVAPIFEKNSIPDNDYETIEIDSWYIRDWLREHPDVWEDVAKEWLFDHDDFQEDFVNTWLDMNYEPEEPPEPYENAWTNAIDNALKNRAK